MLKIINHNDNSLKIRGDKMTKRSQIMKKHNILDFLELTEDKYREQTAVTDDKTAMTWHELAEAAKKIGSGISRYMAPGSPVPVMMEKSPLTLAAMLGAVYAGCFYVPVNPDNPSERLDKIFQTLEARIIIADPKSKEFLLKQNNGCRILLAEDLLKEDIQSERLAEIRRSTQETDILYGIFTSGSTGIPKAVAVSHGAVIRFIGHFTEIFGISHDDVIGNQAPFDFDVSVKDIYSSLMTGAVLTLIPKEFFSTPPRLLDYLCEKKVTTLTWAVSALTLVSSLKGLRYRVPEKVNKVMFSGEAMPTKQLRLWQAALPNARFVNLYGPTEITCNCTYYPINRLYEDGEKIPIGNAFPGREVFLVDEEEQEVSIPGRHGEICVAGESIAQGYYRNEEQTAKAFTEYPVGGGKPQRIYRTGDLGYYDEKGRLIFAGRKDFQIKHMGHRIELEEIENAMNAVENVQKSCCIFQEEKNRIVGFYMGEIEPAEIRKKLKEKLPVYMVPPKLMRMEVMPLNKNGKTDRAYLKKAAAQT